MSRSEQIAQHDNLQNTIVNLVIESWRFAKVGEKYLHKLDSIEQNRYQNQLRWFVKKTIEGLEQAGFKLLNLEGQTFETGMAVTPINIEDFAKEDKLIVEQMLTPTIIKTETGAVIQTGTAILKKDAI